MILIYSILSCSFEDKTTNFKADTDLEEPLEITDTSVSENKEVSFAVIEQDISSGDWNLVVHGLSDWSVGEKVQKASAESILRYKHGFLWLFQRGALPEAIVQYDPDDLSQPLHRYEVSSAEELVYPNDITICNEKVFVTLYDSTDLLVLDENDFSEITRISLESYADEDGLPEGATIICKNNAVLLSLHRFDRREEPSIQMGSLWVVFDPSTYGEITTFPDQGFQSDIVDVPKTTYIGSVIRPHIDVSGTTGFWIFDVIEEVFFSQIYFAYNDKTIFDTAVGSNKVTHLAENYSDGATWLFCHDFTPGMDLSGYSYEELVPTQHDFVSLSMDQEDQAWMIMRTKGDYPIFSMLSIDTNTCMGHDEVILGNNKIVDFEVLQVLPCRRLFVPHF